MNFQQLRTLLEPLKPPELFVMKISLVSNLQYAAQKEKCLEDNLLEKPNAKKGHIVNMSHSQCHMIKIRWEKHFLRAETHKKVCSSSLIQTTSLISQYLPSI